MKHTWPPQADRGARRIVVVSVALAVIVHVGALTWIGVQKRCAAGRPPNVEGFGPSFDTVSGVPMSRKRNIHPFRVVNEENGTPVWRAYVRDVLGSTEAVTDQDGLAELGVRPAAKLIVQVEKPGFAPYARSFGNTADTAQTETIFLTPAEVPYATVDTIFIKRCNYCHGAVGHTVGIDLTSFDLVMASRAHGKPIVVPFNPDSSSLVRTLTDLVDARGKPTEHARGTARIPELELEWIATWIRQGAREQRVKGVEGRGR